MEKNPKSNLKKTIIVVAVIACVAAAAAFVVSKLHKLPEKTYTELWEDIRAGKVKEIRFNDSFSVTVTLKPEGENDKKKREYTSIITARSQFPDAVMDYCKENDIAAPTMKLNDPNAGTNWSTIISVLSFVLIGALTIMIILGLRGKGGGGAMSFGKTRPRVAGNVKIRFSDVAGAEEEKVELREIVDFLKNPWKFIEIGARIPRGVLLIGAPGTGKTLFAKAVAGEANVPFFSISGSDFVEMFVGVGASRVRDLFAQAKKNMPCIIFIDEIDAVGRQRGAGLGGGNDEREQTLNQLLVQMDGFETNDGIIVMAATNRPDILDPALLRPGRFDRQIYIHVPDVKGREEIFKVHSRNKPLSGDMDYRTLARMTSGFTGADIANLLNEAAILAARDDRKIIIMADILEGINKVIAGPQKKSRIITESDKRITAYHEAGHAIVARLLKHCDEVQEVSIIPRGMAAGYTLSRPKNDNSNVTKNKLNDTIAMMLGGRASEAIVIRDISTGASNDIKRASELARKMVCEWGMSERLPNLFYGGDQEIFIGRDYQTQIQYSDAVAATIDEEIKRIIDENYERAHALLAQNREILDNMVKLLYDRETIYSDEVEMLMNGTPIDEINRIIDEKNKKTDEKARSRAQEPNRSGFMPIETIIVPEPDQTESERSDAKTPSGSETDAKTPSSDEARRTEEKKPSESETDAKATDSDETKK